MTSAKTCDTPGVTLYTLYTCEVTAYRFQDLRKESGAVALDLDCDDCVVGPIDLGFAFPYVSGGNSSQAWVSSNGVVGLSEFDEGITVSPGQRRAPGAPTVAGFWADLNPAGGGTVQAATLGTGPDRSFLVQFSKVPLLRAPRVLETFQVVLQETGAIELRYERASVPRGESVLAGVAGEPGVPWGAAAWSCYRCHVDLENPWTLGSLSIVRKTVLYTPAPSQLALQQIWLMGGCHCTGHVGEYADFTAFFQNSGYGALSDIVVRLTFPEAMGAPHTNGGSTDCHAIGQTVECQWATIPLYNGDEYLVAYVKLVKTGRYLVDVECTAGGGAVVECPDPFWVVVRR